MHRYSKTPGPAGDIARLEPQGTSIVFDTVKPTLIVFLHPYCPCSSASVLALEDIISKHRTAAKFYVVFVCPTNADVEWAKSDLYTRCTRNPALTTFIDRYEVEARKYGALTSGQTFVYGPDRRLRFSGGITPSRGAVWAGRERELVESSLDDLPSEPRYAPVFGCALF